MSNRGFKKLVVQLNPNVAIVICILLFFLILITHPNPTVAIAIFILKFFFTASDG